MGKIDLTYINKQIAAKKAAEAQTTPVTQVEEVELFGETYEEFHDRLERKMEEARKAIREMREMGF